MSLNHARRLSVAPMMDWTDRHDRYFLRRLTKHALLYTEMVTTGALLHGDVARHLEHHLDEQPLALQLGGSNPRDLAACARMAEDWGYAEVNLNAGCPSDRVQEGRFGACLMAEPALVADSVAAMTAATALPITVKTRIGIDEQEGYDFLRFFLDPVVEAGCRTVIIHARKAWLSGLSPKENREIPPLHYPVVHRLKQDCPDLTVILNGGITSLDEAEAHLAHVDGVMLGRAAYQTPYVLAEADRRIFGDKHTTVPSRFAVAEAMLPYLKDLHARGVPLRHVTRHMLGLFHGCPGGRAWRRMLSGDAMTPDAAPDVVRAALATVAQAQASRAA